MPGKVKVKIIAGRNLPVMDRSSDTTDAYVEIKLGNTTFKTDVCRKSLNPTWDSEWYRFEVDDSELQDEPLQIRLMDYDTYSANDSIGKVYLDLNPLLLPASPMLGKNAGITDGPPNSGTSLTGGTVLSGWIPVFDTMHGIRGEVNIIVKVELFSDFNKFRQSSCGVQFFCSPTIPQGYHAQVVHGFVEELVVNDDPEYQWIDKIRTPRASNEARQTLFFKLSGEVQRKIGLKALDLGGNAVVGYQQCFDLEGESGIVVRGIGTAVTLMKLQEMAVQPAMPLEPVPPCTEDFQGAVIPSSRPCTNYLRSISLTEPTSRIPTTSLLTEDVTLSDSSINLPERSGSPKFLTVSGTVACNCIITPQMSIVDPTPSSACRMGVISAYDKRMAFSAPARDGSALLDIPVAPLHKSKSATSLLSHPVEHDTNYEDLQHHIKHGPCFVPTSRQLPGEEVADKPPSSPTAGVHSHVVAIASSSKISPSPARLSNLPGIHRRSSDSDLSITPKGNSLTGSDRSSNVGVHFRQPASMVRPTMNQESIDMLEYPFLTMGKYPPGFIVHLGGTVSSRSVKLLERITNLEEPETRDAWWTELRMEVRSHARALGCNVVLGYKENTSICDDVCVLSASGTAAVISLQYSEADGSVQHPLARPLLHNKELMTTSLDRTDFERDKLVTQKADISFPLMVSHKVRSHSDGTDGDMASMCSVCHIPYSESSVPFHVTMLKCAVCRRGKVPDVLFTTIELPEGVPTVGCGCFLQAYVCRPKRDCRGELNAKEISDGLPFLEYELHRMLNYKLKMKGMNAIFGLKVQVSIGERMMVGLATGTAVFLSPLPCPPVPKVSAGNSWSDDKKLVEVQKQIQEAVKKNREIYQLKPVPEPETQSNGRLAASDTEESEDELPELDLAAGNKDTCVFEIDDAEDMDVVSLLLDSQPPDGFHVVNTEIIPGLDDLEIVRNLQMFTQVWRSKIQLGHAPRILNSHVNRLLQSVFFKLRRMIPCALCDLQFHVELPEPDEIQISVLGMALGLAEMEKSSSKCRRKLLPQSSSKELIGKKDDSDMIFSLEEDQVLENSAPAHIQAFRINRPQSPVPVRSGQAHLFKPPHTPPKERYGVDITPLSYVPGGKIERYLGNLNFFFIRESTCIREGGGLSGFVHSFVTEVLAIVRAHVTALGGNAMVAYFMSECVLYHNPHKNQGQCLINVGGDVVFVSYFTEEPTC